MAKYKDSQAVLVADVDCTFGGEGLCDRADVKGYPTIKYGDPSSINRLSAYSGKHKLEDLKAFVEALIPDKQFIESRKSLLALSPTELAEEKWKMHWGLREVEKEMKELNRQYGIRSAGPEMDRVKKREARLKIQIDLVDQLSWMRKKGRNMLLAYLEAQASMVELWPDSAQQTDPQEL